MRPRCSAHDRRVGINDAVLRVHLEDGVFRLGLPSVRLDDHVNGHEQLAVVVVHANLAELQDDCRSFGAQRVGRAA